MRPLGFVVLLASGLFGQSVQPKRVAVFEFDNAAVQGAVSSPFFQTTAPNLGKAVADLLVNHLVKNSSVVVIERSALDKVLSEQNLSNSDRTNALTAAKIGRILGVDAIILGSITKHDIEDKTTGGGGGGFGAAIGRGSMSTKHDLKASVEISARLVSPDTAEVLAVAQGSGVVTKKGVKVDARDMGRLMGMGGAGPNTGPIMNEAIDKAVVQLAAQLDQNVPKIPLHTTVIDGVVADANESGRLIINVGSQNGVKEGDRLQVWRVGKEVRDPVSGKVLLRDDTLLGEAVITKV
ncbi:MAG: CsgG/HfaB family protein, partial [Bryobacteraceae bacterium]